MLLLIKVPCILVSTAGFWITFTPPQPPPAENEKVESTALEGFFVQRRAIFIIKVSYKDIKFRAQALKLSILFYSASLAVLLLLRRQSSLLDMYSTTTTTTTLTLNFYSPISFSPMALRIVSVCLPHFWSGLS